MEKPRVGLICTPTSCWELKGRETKAQIGKGAAQGHTLGAPLFWDNLFCPPGAEPGCWGFLGPVGLPPTPVHLSGSGMISEAQSAMACKPPQERF